MGSARSQAIPKSVAAAIAKCWPDDVVEEFATDESYFLRISPALEWNLRQIKGATLRWQSEAEEQYADWGDDEDMLPSISEFQSYHLFFLAPDGDEFHCEDETDRLEDPDDPEATEPVGTTCAGETWFGCAVGISLCARFAVINPCSYSEFEDGSYTLPEIESFHFSNQTGERMDTEESWRRSLGDEAFAKLEWLRGEIAKVLRKHRIRLLDKSVLELPVPKLQAGQDTCLQAPLRVRDAFFFRGV